MKQLHVLLLLGVLVCAPVLIVSDLQAQNAATPATTASAVSVRTMMENGLEVGQVLVGDQVVMDLRTSAGGYTPGQRAAIIASRLSSLLARGYNWRDLHVEMHAGQPVLMMADTLIATPDPVQARAMHTTPLAEAMNWQDRAQLALQGNPTPVASAGIPGVTDPPGTAMADNPTTLVAGSEESWPSWENPRTKIVPIISAGTPGLRLGFAQITGPSERVDAVKSVIQLDLVFQRVARIRVFVPSRNLIGLSRVQGVAVSALLQYGIFKF